MLPSAARACSSNGKNLWEDVIPDSCQNVENLVVAFTVLVCQGAQVHSKLRERQLLT